MRHTRTRSAYLLLIACVIPFLTAGAAPHATRAVAAGSGAADGARQLWAWGNDRLDRLTSPRRVRGLNAITAIAGAEASLAVRADGTVRAWGTNGSGQLGDGTRKSRAVPVRVRGLTQIKAVAAGDVHSLALRRDGTVWAWGDNSSGELGNGTTKNSLVPVRVRGLTKVVAIAAPNSGWIAPFKTPSAPADAQSRALTRKGTPGGYSMALRSDGTVWVWGNNYFNFTNTGGADAITTPTRVHGLNRVVAIAAGGAHVLALLSDGTVRAWGSDTFDQLGSDDAGNQGPVRVYGLRHVVAIAAGDQASLALRRDGTVWAWGRGIYHRLPNGKAETCFFAQPEWCSSVAVRVPGLTGIQAIAAGGNYDLALRSDGTLWSWVAYNSGQPYSAPNTLRLRRIAGLKEVIAITAGQTSFLAITAGP